jgi:hypothetical protein
VLLTMVTVLSHNMWACCIHALQALPGLHLQNNSDVLNLLLPGNTARGVL